MIVNCKIDVTKIDKSKHLFVGQKGTYLDFQVSELREPDQYGNTHSVYIYQKDTGTKHYLGTGKVFERTAESVAKPDQDYQDLPF